MKFINDSNRYKFFIALAMGLTGFLANFWPLSFDFPPYQTDFLPGLIFPMLVALAWGWRYGLVAAMLGLGCQTPWFTQISSNDWTPILLIPLNTLWVVWHGWCAQQRRQGRHLALNPYIAEIPFRMGSCILMYTILRWLLSLQSILWETHVSSLNIIHFKTVGQLAYGYLVLLLADVVLNLGPVRRFFRLHQQPGQNIVSYVIIIAVLCGLIFWIVDGVVDYYKFSEHLRFLIFTAPESVWDALIFKVSSPNLFARMVYVITCLVSGLLVSFLLRRQLEGEAALRESEVRYRRLHETMWDAFVQMDLSGTILDFNAAYQQMLGYAPEALRGMKKSELMPSKWHTMEARIMTEQVIAKGRSDIYEKEYRRADGSVFPVEMRTFLISDEYQQPLGMWAIVRDITQRKKDEQDRHDTMEALKRSNEDLQQFAYVASHDLQEPLRMVASYTQLLAERYRDQLDEKAQKFIHYAVDGAARMQSLIRDLLSFSRVDTHAEDFEMIDAHQALGMAIANLKAMIDETGALVTTDDLPCVRADKTQLVQVFQNLINNGIKFRSNELSRIHINALQKDGCWLFSVKDNGIGIDPKYKDKVFVVFQRLHTRDAYPGTGIGLALCKRILDRHRGQIWFESNPGQGTTFYFTIPL